MASAKRFGVRRSSGDLALGEPFRGVRAVMNGNWEVFDRHTGRVTARAASRLAARRVATNDNKKGDDYQPSGLFPIGLDK